MSRASGNQRPASYCLVPAIFEDHLCDASSWRCLMISFLASHTGDVLRPDLAGPQGPSLHNSTPSAQQLFSPSVKQLILISFAFYYQARWYCRFFLRLFLCYSIWLWIIFLDMITRKKCRFICKIIFQTRILQMVRATFARCYRKFDKNKKSVFTATVNEAHQMPPK